MSEMGASTRSRRADSGLIALTIAVWVASLGVGAAAWARSSSPLPDGSTMVHVPAGSYPLGAVGDETNYAPPQVVALDAFFLDRREVTNAEFARADVAPPADWVNGTMSAAEADLAVDAVSWQQAADYCSGLGKRLPTEAEWEAAGRGPAGLLYPFPGGVERIESLSERDARTGGRSTASIFGVVGLFGGVWEWVADPYGPAVANSRTLKGGSDGQSVDLAYRGGSAGGPTASVGFRCAADAVRNGTEPALATVVLDDDFSDPGSGWVTLESAEIGVSYLGSGSLRFSVRSPRQGAVVPVAVADLGDVEMEVTAAVNGPAAGTHRFGLALRAAEGRALLFLLEDGGRAWSVQLLESGELQPLATGTLALEPRVGWRLRARAIADELTFEIDGEVVARLDGGRLVAGGVGVYAETVDSAEIDVVFDDAVVRSGPGRDFVDRGE